jgi:DNA modification methylase
MGRSSGGGFGAGSRSRGLVNGYHEDRDNLSWSAYFQWQQRVLLQLWKGLAEDGAIYYNVRSRVQKGELLHPLSWLPKLPLRQIIVWNRKQGINFNDRFYLPSHEWILVFAKPAWRLRDRSAAAIGDVWTVLPERQKFGHPCPFPEALVKLALETTRPRCVLDPFAGSGTTLVAAKRMGIRSIGVEKTKEYCDAAVQRLSVVEPPAVPRRRLIRVE